MKKPKNIIIHGAKNAALPLISATLLEKKIYRFYHVPRTTDIEEQVKLLQQFNVDITWKHNHYSCTLQIDTRNMEIPPSLTLSSDIRASYYFIGSTLHYDADHLGYPCGNGCSIDRDNRKIDYHEELITLTGKKVYHYNNRLFVSGTCRQKNIEYTFAKPSVGATINAMMMFCKIDGLHSLYNCAQDPYIAHVAGFINHLYGVGTIVIKDAYLSIDGHRYIEKTFYNEKTLCYKIIPDPIESITYIIFSAMCLQDNTTSSYTIGPMEYKHGHATFSLLQNIGIELLHLKRKRKRCYYVKRCILKSFTLETGYYPGIYTDCQPFFAALALSAKLECTIKETIWNSRFHYIKSMQQCGYIKMQQESENIIHIQPQNKYNIKIPVDDITCTDLRGGMALYMLLFKEYKHSFVLQKKQYIDRGYVDYEEALSTIVND